MMDVLILYLYLSIIMDNSMNKRPRFLQEYFCLDFEKDFGYLVLIEIVDDIPIASFIVKIPASFKYYEETHNYYATTPN